MLFHLNVYFFKIAFEISLEEINKFKKDVYVI